VVLGDRVWTGEFDGIVALDADTGTVLQRHDVGAEVATVVARGDRAVVVTVDGSAVAVPEP
jgi:hypothetical protein